MKEVYDGGNLFIGNKEDAFTCLTQDTDITHILTIEAEPLSDTERYDKGDSRGIILKHVECLDQLKADLLSRLDECVIFIDDAVQTGKILVHCSAGISRSVTVVLAYMMRKQDIPLHQALDDLRTVYPKANPNPGFMFQLYLFEKMGMKLDESNLLYKQYKLRAIAEQMHENGYKEIPAGLLNLKSDTQGINVKKLKNYKCRKCRKTLFTSENRLGHVPGTGTDFLSWDDKFLTKQVENGNMEKCTSYFIEPLSWMASLLIGNVNGKICCPKCSGRLGSFNWAGEQCSCGCWVTPAFRLHRSRIDEC